MSCRSLGLWDEPNGRSRGCLAYLADACLGGVAPDGGNREDKVKGGSQDLAAEPLGESVGEVGKECGDIVRHKGVSAAVYSPVGDGLLQGEQGGIKVPGVLQGKRMRTANETGSGDSQLEPLDHLTRRGIKGHAESPLRLSDCIPKLCRNLV